MNCFRWHVVMSRYKCRLRKSTADTLALSAIGSMVASIAVSNIPPARRDGSLVNAREFVTSKLLLGSSDPQSDSLVQ